MRLWSARVPKPPGWTDIKLFVLYHDPARTPSLSHSFGQHPAGFAEPDRKPLYPQRYAELMGGRIPLSLTESIVPRSLDEVIVGPVTAEQIRWLP